MVFKKLEKYAHYAKTWCPWLVLDDYACGINDKKKLKNDINDEFNSPKVEKNKF